MEPLLAQLDGIKYESIYMDQEKIESPFYKIFESKNDKRIKTVYNQGQVRAVFVDALQVSEYLCNLHKLDKNTAPFFAEAILGALLTSSTLKNTEIMNLYIKSLTRNIQATIDIDSDASLRGILSLQGEFKNKKDQEDRGPWGQGLISVLKAKKNDSTPPYIGTIELPTGFLAKDLTYYFAQSEQIPSAMGLLVEQDSSSGKIKTVRGFLIQMMPGASEEDIQKIEKALEKREDLVHLMKQEKCNSSMLFSQLYLDESFMILEEKPVSVFCKCSRERVENSLMLLGKGELEKLLEEKKPVELSCDFCEKKYEFSQEQIKKLLNC